MSPLLQKRSLAADRSHPGRGPVATVAADPIVMNLHARRARYRSPAVPLLLFVPDRAASRLPSRNTARLELAFRCCQLIR